jgi:hypothetical protein
MVPPFVWIREQLWVVANWDVEMPEDAWLLLRLATEEESDNYRECTESAEAEAFWTSVLVDEDRLKGRRDQQRRG